MGDVGAGDLLFAGKRCRVRVAAHTPWPKVSVEVKSVSTIASGGAVVAARLVHKVAIVRQLIQVMPPVLAVLSTLRRLAVLPTPRRL